MKKLLLLKLFSLVTVIAYPQSISGYFSAPSSMYAAVEATPSLDHGMGGMDAFWDFTNLVATAATTTDFYKDIALGSAEEIQYPLSNYEMSNLTSTGIESNFYFLNIKALDRVAVTGTESLGLMLQYDDPGLIGDFPFNFNGTNGIDDIRGDFSFGAFNGTFKGTLTSTVDAYGMLNTNDVGGGPYSGNVTRLKIEQLLELTVGILSGNVSQTTYHYYDNASGELVLRTTILDISTPLGNESQVTIESLISEKALNTTTSLATIGFKLDENPVEDFLSFSIDENILIKSLQVFDFGGREVFKLNTIDYNVDVSSLTSGMYVLKLETDKGLFSHKFIKL